MNPRRWLAVFPFLALGLLGQAVQGSSQPPKDLAKWDLICFCSAQFFTPHSMVKIGNNGQILYQAGSGITRADLRKKGIPFTERQLKVLDACGLLDASGPTLRTAIPVLGPKEMERLRAALQKHAESNAPLIKRQIQDLVQALKQQGFAEHAYSVVFSYVLDGLVWEQFEKQGLMPKMETTPEKPFWDGTFYAVYPIRTGKPGTNSASHGSWTLAQTWTEATLQVSGSSGFTKSTHALLAHLAASGSPSDPTVVQDLQHCGLLGADGQLAIPVIHERAEDPVHAAGLGISKEIAKGMTAIVSLPNIQKLLRTSDSKKGIVMGYHEYMWELLAHLESEGVIQRPPSLQGSEPVQAKDLHNLVYLVEGAP